MSDRIDEWAKRLVNSLFLPFELARPEVFSRPTLILTVLILLATPILAAPPLRELIANYLFHVQCLTPKTRQYGKEYSDFAKIAFQILIVVLISGLVVTQRTTNYVRTVLDSIQSRREQAVSSKMEQLRNDLYGSYLELKRQGKGITIWNAIPRAITFVRTINGLLHTVGVRVPIFYYPLLMVRVTSAFPLGLYGVLALTLFECQILALVAKTYFDYLPPCEVIPTAPH
jgi:hypothetical protein